MGMQYRKSKMVLNYRESKPEVWKAKQITFPTVSYEQLVEEIAQSRGVNTNSTRAVVDALLNRLVHYMEIGHGVSLGSFGSFKPTFVSKVAQSAEDIPDTLVPDGTKTRASRFKKKVRFFPGGKFAKMLKSLSLTEAEVLSEEEEEEPEP